jgi:hypothetical protein
MPSQPRSCRHTAAPTVLLHRQQKPRTRKEEEDEEVHAEEGEEGERGLGDVSVEA